MQGDNNENNREDNGEKPSCVKRSITTYARRTRIRVLISALLTLISTIVLNEFSRQDVDLALCTLPFVGILLSFFYCSCWEEELPDTEGARHALGQQLRQANTHSMVVTLMTVANILNIVSTEYPPPKHSAVGWARVGLTIAASLLTLRGLMGESRRLQESYVAVTDSLISPVRYSRSRGSRGAISSFYLGERARDSEAPGLIEPFLGRRAASDSSGGGIEGVRYGSRERQASEPAAEGTGLNGNGDGKTYGTQGSFDRTQRSSRSHYSVQISHFAQISQRDKELKYSKLLNALEQWNNLQEAIRLSLTDQPEKQAGESIKNSRLALQEQAAHFGYSCQDVRGDGRCFYHAFVLQLQRMSPSQYGDLSVAECLGRIAQHMIDNQAHYEEFVQQRYRTDLNGFLNTMLMNTGQLQADHILIFAASRAFNVDVGIVRSDGSVPTVFRRSDPVGRVYLGYEVGRHYQALVRDNSIVEPGGDLDASIDAAEPDNWAADAASSAPVP